MEITLIHTRIEVPYHRRGRKPTYRWVEGYKVIDPKTGCELQPYMRCREAKRFARQELGATSFKVKP